MPRNRTKFNKEWLEMNDGQGFKIGQWCEHSKSNFEAYCILCKKTVHCDNQGASQLKQHAKGESHNNLANQCLKGQTTLSFQSVSSVSTDTPESSQSTVAKPALIYESPKDRATRAEIIWAMKVAISNYSNNSCSDIKDTFEAMFPGAIPSNFTMSASKISHLISYGTGPYFLDLLIDDIKKSDSLYTIQYDETTNRQVNKQLDLNIRYWSEKHQQIIVHHLKTYLLGHATGQILANKILDVINDSGLMLKNLLMLGSDGSNVNKTVFPF